MLALMLGFCVVSCKEKSEQAAKAGDAVEKVDENLSLEDIVAKAKAEGANWTADEWKANMKSALAILAPTLKEFAEMTEKVKADPSKAMELVAEMEKKQVEFEPIKKMIDELDSIAGASDIGKAVMEDTVWTNQVKKELGIPDEI